MPRYFFHVHNLPPTSDDVDEELPNDEAAWHEATVYAGEVLKDLDGRISPGHEWSLEVTDQSRNPLFHIRISTGKLK